MINIRKLAAVDMAFHGTRFIVAEFALGVVLPFILGLLSLRSGLHIAFTWQVVIGIWLMTIAANYIPLFIYSVLIAKAGSVKEEGQPEIANAKRYGIQQMIILVPFMVVVVAIVQELRQRKR